jgi:hypothetical protein
MLPNMRPVPWRPRAIEPMRTPPRRTRSSSLAPVPTTPLSRLLYRFLRLCRMA